MSTMAKRVKKFKKGDEVLVTTGKDKGKKGKIEKVFSKNGQILVSGVNLYKKHIKAKSAKQPGGIVEIAKPLSLASVALVCPKCSLSTRVGLRVISGKKERFCKKCKQAI